MVFPRRFADHRPGQRWIFSLLLAGSCAGCGTLSGLAIPFASKPVPPSVTPVVNPLDANWDRQLSDRLQHPLWKKRPDWTPEAAARDGQTYWILGLPKVLPKSLDDPKVRGQSPDAPAASATEPVQDVPDELVDLEDPLTLLSTDRADRVIASLKRIADEDDLVALQAIVTLASENIPLTNRQKERLLNAMLTGEWQPHRVGIDFDFNTGTSAPSTASVANKDKIVLNDASRAAATEAWCRSLLTTGKGTAADRLSEAGLILRDSMLTTTVQAQLIRSLSSELTPSRIPMVQSMFVPDKKVAAAKELKIAAIEGCLVHAYQQPIAVAYQPTMWPEKIEDLENDRSTELRKYFALFVARTGHPRAIEILKHQLHDSDYSVKISAVHASVELLDHPEQREAAIEILRSASHQTAEQLRVASLDGLAKLSLDELRPFIKDPSEKVREALATTLSAYPSAIAGTFLIALASDASLQVQLASVSATRDWPVEMAQPVWMEAYRAGSVKTRQEAAELSYTRAHITLEKWRDSIDVRQQEIQQVAVNHAVKTHYDRVTQPIVTAERSTNEALRRDELLEAIARLEDDVPTNDDEAITLLKSLKPYELGSLESRIRSLPVPRRERFETDILVHAFPEFAALADLKSSDVMARRSAATDLKHVGDERTISELVTTQLPARLKQEYDVLVWRYIMQSIERDARPSCQEIAREALRSPWADIQILGCEYVTRHRATALTSEIAHLLNSSETTVLLSAINAAASTGHPWMIDGMASQNTGDIASNATLRSLLTYPDRRVRQASVVALAKLGDPQGKAELTKLSYDLEPRVRIDAIRALRQMASTDSARSLVKMLWTERNDQVRQEILNGLDELVPANQRPASLASARTLHEKVESWITWLDRPESMVYDQASLTRTSK
jgi:HEAT repeat protein